MRSLKDVEAYLLRLGRRYETPEGEGSERATYLLAPSGKMPPIVLRVEPPLVVLRVHVGNAKAGEPPALLRRLLELNAQALVHSSYGLDGERIVLSSALELENLDFNELQAALDEIDLALAQHVPLASLSADSKAPPARSS